LKESTRHSTRCGTCTSDLKNAVETYGVKIKTTEDFDSMRDKFGVEEKYILSRMNSPVRDMTKKFDAL